MPPLVTPPTPKPVAVMPPLVTPPTPKPVVAALLVDAAA